MSRECVLDPLRRRLLVCAAAMPLAACVSFRAHGQMPGGNLPNVTADDPAAKALGFPGSWSAPTAGVGSG